MPNPQLVELQYLSCESMLARLAALQELHAALVLKDAVIRRGRGESGPRPKRNEGAVVSARTACELLKPAKSSSTPALLPREHCAIARDFSVAHTMTSWADNKCERDSSHDSAGTEVLRMTSMRPVSSTFIVVPTCSNSR